MSTPTEQPGCSTGNAGPPFSPTTAARMPGFLTRWLPWNWYSIGGSGWCYHAEWDRMQRCAEMDVPVDWNGVGLAPAADTFGFEPPYRALLGVLLTACALTAYAYSQYAYSPAAGGGAPALREWLRSPHAMPWAWEHSARLVALGALGGLAVGFLTPLPTITISFAQST